MGATVSQFWAPPPITVGLIGLRSAGKTTIVHKLSGNSESVMPSVESHSGVPRKPTVQTFRLRWKSALETLLEKFHVQTIIVDSTDRDALQEAKMELVGLLKGDMLEQQPFLVLANKQDDMKAMSVTELTEYLDIQQFIDKPLKCCIHGSIAFTGEGLGDGLKWVRQVVRS